MADNEEENKEEEEEEEEEGEGKEEGKRKRFSKTPLLRREASVSALRRGIIPEEEEKLTLGALLGILIGIGALALFFLQLIDYVPSFGLLNLGLYGFLAFLSAVLAAGGGHYRRGVGLFLLILILGFSLMWLQTTPLGKQVSGELGAGGVQTVSGFRAVVGPLNIVKQIFTGEYNPEYLWRSDYVKSEYQEAKDVGVRILSAAPVRDKFSTEQELVIQGRIDAVSFPNTDVTANLSACTLEKSSSIGEWLKCSDTSWTCCVAGNCGNPAQIKVRQARNRIFSCNHSSLNEEKYKYPYPVELTVKAVDTTAAAGKQFVFANPKALLALPEHTDPIKAFGLSRDALKSWQAGDDSITVALGIAGEPDVLEAGNLEYYLGVNVANPVSHTGKAFISKIELFLPQSPSIFSNESDFSPCKPASQSDLESLGMEDAQGISLLKCTWSRNKPLEPGERIIKFVKVRVSEDQLYSQDFGTFFALAKVTFDYENKRTVILNVGKI